MAALLVVATLGATPAPSAAPAAERTWCPIAVDVTVLDATRVALELHTSADAGRSSGVVSLYTTTSRYDVRFEHAYVSSRSASSPGSPSATALVIRFPAATAIDAAAVTELDAPTPGPCDPLYAPWRPGSDVRESALPPKDRARAEARRARLEALPTQAAPAPVPYRPASCAHPNVSPRTVKPFAPDNLMRYQGTVMVLVTVDVDGRAVGTDVLKSSGNHTVDGIAQAAAMRSGYSAETFNCAKIVGTYVFMVDFSR